MKVVGLITEYNPFHNGHLHHIQSAKELTGADYVIVVMSGNFLQRGTPAIIDKYKRTQMALLCGADLVVELPCTFATASAELFAAGAISLLTKMGCVDFLCFGSECGNITLLDKVADTLVKEPACFKESLKGYLKEGLPFPVARKKVLLSSVFKEDSQEEWELLLSEPNNILGIEYLKAIKKQKSGITPITIQRIVSSYHDQTIKDSICSASAIRTALQANGPEGILHQVPPFVYDILCDAYQKTFPIYMNDFSSLLKYSMMLSHNRPFTKFLDVSDSLSHAILNQLSDFKQAESFFMLLKNKQYTHTRISRSLMHILLQIEKEKTDCYLANDYSYYIRVLGFQKSSSALLTAIHNHGSIPIISKLADYKKNLSPLGVDMLEQDIFASDIYYTIVTDKFHSTLTNEFKQKIIII